MKNNPILLAEHKNHISGYGFYSDAIGLTIYGVPIKVIENYTDIYTEFTIDETIDPYIVSIPYFLYEKIPRGTLKVYGFLKEIDFQI